MFRKFYIGETPISNIVISTILGFGDGMPLLRLTTAHKNLLNTVRRSHTTILTKSITRDKNKGNFNKWNPLTWKHIKLLENDTMYNNYKLTNPGSIVVSQIIKNAKTKGSEIIPNIWANSLESFLDAYRFLDFPPVIEFNLSCPNKLNCLSQATVIKGIKAVYPNLHIIAKIGYYHLIDDIKRFEDAGVSAFHSINSVPVRAFNGTYKFKEGAISGGAAFTKGFEVNSKIKSITTLPVIMGCGVVSMEHIKIYRNLGADAISICSLARINPELVSDLLWEYNG
jgi:dihydroorotate dehydrogenase